MRLTGHVARMGGNENTYEVLIRSREGKSPLRKPRNRWEGNIRMDLRETGWKDVHWMHLAQDRDQWHALVNTVMNLWIP